MNAIKKTLRKYWLIPSFLLLVEAGIGIYSAKKHKSFIETHKYIINKAKPSLVYHAKTIPKDIRYYFGIDQIKRELLEKAAGNPRTIERVKKLFRRDIKKIHSEVSGIATLNWDKNDCFIKFYEIENKNENIVKELNTAKSKNDYKEIVNIIKENEDFFMKIMGMNHKEEYKQLLSNISDSKERVKKKHFSRLIDDIIEKADYSGIMYSKGDMIDFYNKTSIKGEYIGYFHTHNYGSGLSENDRKASSNARQIVLSFTKEGFDLYDIIKGSSSKINVCAGKDWEIKENCLFVKKNN